MSFVGDGRKGFNGGAVVVCGLFYILNLALEGVVVDGSFIALPFSFFLFFYSFIQMSEQIHFKCSSCHFLLVLW